MLLSGLTLIALSASTLAQLSGAGVQSNASLPTNASRVYATLQLVNVLEALPVTVAAPDMTALLIVALVVGVHLVRVDRGLAFPLDLPVLVFQIPTRAAAAIAEWTRQPPEASGANPTLSLEEEMSSYFLLPVFSCSSCVIQ
ncbi:hypothetical protein INS49_001334 [Diaporthe citri]|uniref:uncharacterized protein n=1 Tax=Diaporthe citri TaxID=83186 RepID=UPI001C81FAFA|nr:uncharacterized protein INS49_001334 [Diaporthe citri]KAG6367151.1 hypothetical protein INS49_001334 [Diaporthe citri]